MQAFIDFLVNNYLWFLVISLILVFALIGYLVDTNEKKEVFNQEEQNEQNDSSIHLGFETQNMEMLEDQDL